jgi:hypothetical protein
MRLPFRRRLFLGLVLLGTAPLAATLVVLALQQRSGGSLAGPRAALDEVALSGRAVLAALDTLELDEEPPWRHTPRRLHGGLYGHARRND